MFHYTCLNPIADVGLNKMTDLYQKTDDIKEADAVLVRSASMHDMELPDSLCAVARAGAGVNNIPLDTCAQKGIVVFNTPGANANGVKELVLAGMLLASRDLKGGMDWVLENKDDPAIGKTMEKAKKKFAGKEIQGKKLGVIGLGAIGVLVANAAAHLGMEVYGCDPYLSVENALKMSRSITLVKSQEELFTSCDFITLHVPLLDSTRHLICRETLNKMKKGSILLNFARTELVDDDALEEALQSGQLSRYVTDFPDCRIAGLPHVIAFPHLGASTEESEDNCAVMAVQELMDYLENGNIVNSVNYPSCSLGKAEKPTRICIAHKNVPGMISQFTSLIGEYQLNICDMISKSRNDYSYAMFDLDHTLPDGFTEKLLNMDGILKVRIIESN